jgi:predicted flap endonuclease-1-like 5' DNA nuclease
MSEERELYIWLEGDFTHLPKIQARVAPHMPLSKFRDKYVPVDRSHLIMRVYAVTDEEGNTFTINLEPTELPNLETSETISGTTLTGIKGIGRKYTAMLREKAGIESIEELLEAGITPQGRAELVQKTGRNDSTILHWVQLADLMRVEGVGEDYSALLWETGITSPADLPRQKPESLLELLTKTNQQKRLTHRLPSLSQIISWMEQAKKLPVVVKEA